MTNFTTFGIIFHTFSLMSSSFIEEEHQTWYYLGNTLFLLLCFDHIRRLDKEKLKYNEKHQRKSRNNYGEIFNSSVLFFIMHIFVRRLNQTGDKWSHLKDIGDWLVLKENIAWLSALLFISEYQNDKITSKLKFIPLFFLLTGLCYLLYKLSSYQGFLTNILSFSTCLLIYYYRVTTNDVSLFGVQAQK